MSPPPTPQYLAWVTGKSNGFPYLDRRTGNFLPGGAVNHLPKKIWQVAQIFTKESKRNEGHIATT